MEITTGATSLRDDNYHVWKKNRRDCGTLKTAAPRRIRFPQPTLPHRAKLPVCAGFSKQVFLKHMKNIKKEASNDSVNLVEQQLRKLSGFGAAGLKLARQILAKLEKVEGSVEILARQNARELTPDKSPEPRQS